MADGNDEIELAPAPKSLAQIRTGRTMALVPSNVDEAWRIAQAFARSGMCPKGMDQPEQVLVAVMAGAEIGLAPFQAVQSFAVINGRPSLWGDGMLAVVRQFGVQVSERLEGDGEATVAWCKVTRPSGETIERSFSVADAKAANLWKKAGPWTTYPKRMLQMRARAWALRDGCADMLRGMHMAEEAQDMEVIADVPIGGDKPFINGAKKDDLVRVWNESFRKATTPEELDATMKLIADYPGRFSDNTMDGLLAVHAQEYERVTEGGAPQEPQPSPFTDEKEKALACVQMEDRAAGLAALLAWKAALTKEKLGRCTSDEKNELLRLFSNCKKAFTDA